MEKLKSAAEDTPSALKNLQRAPPRNLVLNHPVGNEASGSPYRNKKPRRLVSLCIGVLGQHFEDIIPDISEISAEIPAEIKLVLLGIARRRQLLNDNVLFALAESLWEILDISGSDVTDACLSKISQICTNLRAVDISRCDRITVVGVTNLFNNCRSLATLRCGGSPRCDFTARRCLDLLKPNLNFADGESWEELEIMDIGGIAQSLRWLVWPKIDSDSSISMATECARICVNPQGSTGFRGLRIPVEAVHSVSLDHEVIQDIDPKTWAVSGAAHARKFPNASVVVEDVGPKLSMAEKFRLAFMDRDARLAPKRAKNERQNRRRAEKELLMTSTSAKSLALASQAAKFLFNRS
ncbi:hypothetical protein KSP40_PGU011434 [Platanthera guangdongensis]|uniref:RNI-like superfamily protein n=1 Tax=Platanthera guangdongensis TaxID=2320717 RepID=A0ABR2N0C1_9ASPA